MRDLDILFVNTNISQKIYQALADKWTAIEPPTWSLLLAESCRSKGYGVAILDAQAEQLTNEQTAQRIIDTNPKFCCFVTYGQNPNSGTTGMVGVYEVAELVKEASDIKTISIGSHTSALPYEVLDNKNIDYVSMNEGVYLLHSLLNSQTLDTIPGLGYISNGNTTVLNNGCGSIVPQQNMDIDLPGYAWDLLPYNKKPFDLYRAHLWHAEYQDKYRTPFAAIYTSLGCKFKCDFCMINIINRESTEEGTHAAHTNNMRFWSPELIIKEFDKLVNDYGVTTIRISDEMFYLNRKYYEPLLLMLKERGYGDILRMWSYTRIDTINPRFLDLFREGGIKWLACGIEAANQEIRREITKGKFQNVNIHNVVQQARNHGIYIGSNFIFGHPTEKLAHMQETLDLALELNTEFANFYTAMALPGSPLYYRAKDKGWMLPSTPESWAFHSYDCQPLPTEYLKPEEVLEFRDKAWHQYFENPKFLSMIQSTFGTEAKETIQEQSKIKLKRRILEHERTT